MDLWEEVVKKAVNAEAKASLQSLFKTRKIDSRCKKSYRPSAKKDTNEAHPEYWDEYKAKSHNPSFANIS